MKRSDTLNIETIEKALVVGLGYRTGLWASNFLAGRGIKVTVSDIKGHDELKETAKKLHPSVKLVLGAQEPALLKEGFQCLILSPGVPANIPLVTAALTGGIPVISEVELAYLFIRGGIIGVTGTDGKTTTTSLTGHILKDLGLDVFVGGNIGTPLISFADRTGPESVTVAELSSFQLETIGTFRPRVAAVLNVTPDHLDRYDGMESYFAAKMRIAMNQGPGDFFIYNLDDAALRLGAETVKSRRLSFSLADERADIFHKDGSLHLKRPGGTLKVLDTGKLLILGLHNVQNAMAALLMVYSILESRGLKPDYDRIAASCCSFPPLEHRMEKIGEFMGRTFINDSKATTVGAVEMALRSIGDQGVLILGGRTKGDDYSRLIPSMKGRVRALVLIGESGREFSRIFSGMEHMLAATMDEAVSGAMGLSRQGDVILLSPACASFDMFKSYEDRGNVFKDSFRKLTSGELSWN